MTGGAGFIGSHVVDHLIEGGRRVIVIDDLSTGKLDNLERWRGDDRLTFVRGDVAEGIGDLGPVDRVIHLAAQTSVTRSLDEPLFEVRNNYVGTVQVLELARRVRARKVVFASSAAVYGDVAELPVTEAAPTRPLSPYGVDKRAGELMLGVYSAVHGVPTTALRFFNVYGPRQDPASPYSGVISIFAERAMSGRPLVIFGDGQQTRDFVYVAEVARAVVSACLGDAGDGAVVNIGTGRETTIAELAAQMVALAGRGSEIRHQPARPGEIRRSLASAAAARELLGVDLGVTSLADGLSATLDWMRRRS
ncbi:MAG TPA: NAD-dependent epimerase/dehydratase family protein [Kofleriaceae bacterium]|nr:NAD-dependent epimerase/dehydratase family protein [Kofleriaceae bacterium]